MTRTDYDPSEKGLWSMFSGLMHPEKYRFVGQRRINERPVEK